MLPYADAQLLHYKRCENVGQKVNGKTLSIEKSTPDAILGVCGYQLVENRTKTYGFKMVWPSWIPDTLTVVFGQPVLRWLL